MADPDFDFEAEMRALGVRPTRSSPPKSSRRTPRPAKSRPSPTPAKKAAPAPPANPGKARPAARAASVAQSTPNVQALESELARTRAELRNSQDQLAESADALIEVRSKLQAACSENTRLQQRLSKRQPGEVTPTLLEVFRERGVFGEAEVRQVWKGLDERGVLRDVLESVTVAHPEPLASWLDENVALLGDCGQCPDSGSRAILRVPRARCEVCGGSDIRRTGRKFVDQFLNRGFTRVTVVGGSPKYHRQLRELIKHHRVRLRTVPGQTRRSRKQARDDIRGSDLVIVWGGTQLAHSTSDQYTSQTDEGRVVVVQHRGIAGMLEAVTSALHAE